MKKLIVILALILASIGLKTSAEAVSGVCSTYRSWSTGDQLTASDLTNSFTQIGVTNDNPDCQSSHATSVGAIQSVRHPFSTGLNPDLTPNMTGEIQSLRGMILRTIQGMDSANSAQWYVPPLRLQNHSGGGVVAGDIIVLDPGSPLAAYTTGQSDPGPRFVVSTAHVNTRGIIGIALESIAHAAYGRVAFTGIHHIGVTGDVHVGAYLVPSTSVKLAAASKWHANVRRPPSGAFAVAIHAVAGPLGASVSHVRAWLFGGSPRGVPMTGEVFATDSGAVCDGSTDDTEAIRSALALAAHTQSFTTLGGYVTLPAGVCVIKDQLVVQDRVVLRGQGVRVTQLHVTTQIPINRPVIRLGAGQGTSLAFNSRIEDMEINLNHVANIGLFSDSANEKSGASRIRIIGWLTHGVALIDSSTSMFNTNYDFRDVEMWKSLNSPVNTGIGVFIQSVSKTGGAFSRLMVGQGASTGRQGLYGVYVLDTGTGGASVKVENLNVESYQAGVFLANGSSTSSGGGINLSGAALLNASGGPGAGISLLVVHSSNSLRATELLRSGGTNLVDNDTISHAVAGSLLKMSEYAANVSTDGYQVYSDAGSNINTSIANVVSASTTAFTVGTTSGTARPLFMLKDGNGDGWQIRHGTPDTGDPFQLLHVTASFVGSTIFNLEDTGRLTMKSGSSNHFRIGQDFARSVTDPTNALTLYNGTAPSGTLTGGATLYTAAGEMTVMDASGNATPISPHDQQTGEWRFISRHTPSGRVLRVDMERMMKYLNDLFGLDYVHEYYEGVPH